ncbi:MULTISPECIES: phosphopantothenate--cysteine ligase [Streptococcus]|uniref:Phosphopantothenate--cysteine ligase n=1 Tax=Streptococcus pseudopneumoniae TaxID=257758 RepID=A0A0T8U789_9STRE|nr:MULTISPECIES: phosphopantothenate--cysteine ligase [Streptococcus]RJQ62036.1 phosphopantothenate--cysteine ligase [Streptococcus pseudopneumoniae]RJY07595.1 phosphopantothenate--cysteine ligase [Streptococcus pseudopneumoniae]CIZ68813.1 phosphopantothenate--cysteine ligase [Streptococcus pneumoniae]CKA91843.1 phosphopantothenate--cysteine ligase [Streptococcus pseudopneumoniae]COQ26429.1 phosphopantothenate--cysteine ligase [Streptococcus pneumoniae]
MKILVTSGGTSEAIDSVRSITNHSTGRLGKIITETLLASGHEVCLMTTKRALKPKAHPNLSIQEINNTNDLLLEMQERIQDYQVLIHSMAVSDYTPVYMTGLEEVQASSNLEEFLNKQNHQAKISSTDEVQVLFLKKTPKIISLVKEWNPTIHLIGFKLLVDVNEYHLVDIARKSLVKNQADLIIANDLTQISENQHHAIFVEKNQLQTVQTKEEIAELLLEKIQAYHS